MDKKLNQILESEQLTVTKLAQLLDVRPSNISHLIVGRNKPSFDFVVKLLRRFPRINPDWLLLDSGEMYRSDTDSTYERSAYDNDRSNDTPTLFGLSNAETDSSQEIEPETDNSLQTGIKHGQQRSCNRDIDKIIVFYTDQTFECFNKGQGI